MSKARFIILLAGVILLFYPVLGFTQPQAEKGFTVNVQVGELPAPPPPPPPGGVPAPPLPTKVVFKGRAYPKAFLTILKDDKVAATFKAFSSGLFERELTGLAGGTYTFSIFAEDTEGRKSVTLSFTIGVLERRTTTISGIFVPPTIALTPTQIERGEVLNIFGQAFPGSQVLIFISPDKIVKKTLADKRGKWKFKLDTSPLEEREYEVKAQALYGDGEQSPFSQILKFLVLPPACKGADLNFDGRVDLVDFSILLYYWEESKPVNHCADINFDGIVDLVDFSIMMYYWTS